MWIYALFLVLVGISCSGKFELDPFGGSLTSTDACVESLRTGNTSNIPCVTVITWLNADLEEFYELQSILKRTAVLNLS